MAFTQIAVRSRRCLWPVVLWILLAAWLVVGLIASASASIPLAIDRNDGYTFSGLETNSFGPRSMGPPFPINEPISVPPPTTTPRSGTATGSTVILGYSREEQSGYISGCPPNPAARSVVRTIRQDINRAVLSFTTSLSGPLQLDALTVAIPTVDNDNGTTVLPFDGVFSFGATITANGVTTGVPLTPTPIAGADLGFSGAISPLRTISGQVTVVVTIQGPASPPVTVDVVPPPPAPPNIPVPPGPNVCAGTLARRGVAKVEFQNPSVVLFVDDPPSSRPTTLEFTRVAPTGDPTRVSITVRLTRADDGSPLPGKSVLIATRTADDAEAAVTDGNGEATVIQPGSLLADVADAVFIGDVEYAPSQASTTFALGPRVNDRQYLVFPAIGAFAANGGSGTAHVTTVPPDASWTAASDNPAMVDIISGGPTARAVTSRDAAGTGDGAVTYQVARHADPMAGRAGTLTIAGLTVPVLQGAAFRDVPEGAPFYTEIGKLSARGVTSGIGGGNYGPDQPVTRGQMAVFIIRALGEPDPPPSMPSFTDVPPGHPFFRFIQRLKELNITSGCSATAYCPDAAVTRGQMAVFIIRALGEFDPPPSMPSFTDVPPGHPFFRFIQRMRARGITSGCSATAYCPDAPVTRGQMAVFLIRAFFP